jgi:hypothetical protein
MMSSKRTYIKRKSKIAYHQENYLNLLKFTKRLLLLVPSEREHIVHLKTEIQTTKALAERKWLLEKVERYGKEKVTV